MALLLAVRAWWRLLLALAGLLVLVLLRAARAWRLRVLPALVLEPDAGRAPTLPRHGPAIPASGAVWAMLCLTAAPGCGVAGTGGARLRCAVLRPLLFLSELQRTSPGRRRLLLLRAAGTAAGGARIPASAQGGLNAVLPPRVDTPGRWRLGRLRSATAWGRVRERVLVELALLWLDALGARWRRGSVLLRAGAGVVWDGIAVAGVPGGWRPWRALCGGVVVTRGLWAEVAVMEAAALGVEGPCEQVGAPRLAVWVPREVLEVEVEVGPRVVWSSGDAEHVVLPGLVHRRRV